MTHSFPTRRSSDLGARSRNDGRAESPGLSAAIRPRATTIGRCSALLRSDSHDRTPRRRRARGRSRSEEHTSELQSLMRISYAVFSWKKKTRNKDYRNRQTSTQNTSAEIQHTHTTY